MEARTVPTWTLSDRLTKARQVAGLKQDELANVLGLNRRTVIRYEAGEIAMYPTLLSWADACGVSVSWLLTGDDSSANSGANTHGEPDQLHLELVA